MLKKKKNNKLKLYFLVTLYHLDCSNTHLFHFKCWWQSSVLTVLNEHDSHIIVLWACTLSSHLSPPWNPSPALLCPPHPSFSPLCISLPLAPSLSHTCLGWGIQVPHSLLLPECHMRQVSWFSCQLLISREIKPVFLLLDWDRVDFGILLWWNLLMK